MVNFIKENLLGSLKEFRNRFINPIQNGQCADSTPADVRLMKNRSHVLHQMMSGFIQVMKRERQKKRIELEAVKKKKAKCFVID